MENLTSFEKSYLRGLANPIKPLVFIGKGGLTEQVTAAIEETLDAHELIKIRFLEFKEGKKLLTAEIEKICRCECVGMIGHVALFYRRQSDEKKRRIQLPQAKNKS